MALAVDIVLSDSSKGGSPLSELPGLAVFWMVVGGGGRPGGREDRVLGIRARPVIFV